MNIDCKLTECLIMYYLMFCSLIKSYYNKRSGFSLTLY